VHYYVQTVRQLTDGAGTFVLTADQVAALDCVRD
jgi:hypothetical protein